MKASKNLLAVALISATAAMGLYFSSCSKQDMNGVRKGQSPKAAYATAALRGASFEFSVPSEGKKIVSSGSGTTYVNPSQGTNYSNPSQGQTYTPPSEGTKAIDVNAIFSQGSGSMEVDGKSINLNYVACGEDFISFEDSEGEEDITAIIGFDGDLSALADSSDELEGINYIVEVIIFKKNAQGSFKINEDNFFEEDQEGAMILVIDLTKARGDENEGAVIYIAKSGTVNVNNGEYTLKDLKLIRFENLFFDEIDEEDQGKTVSGSGSISCK